MTDKSLNRGKQLRLARIYRGHTQKELCNKLKGLKHSNLSKFENGFENQLSDDTLKSIMKLLNFPFEFLDKKISISNASW